jgi:hypothetical protein
MMLCKHSPPQQKPAAPIDVTPLLLRAAIKGLISSQALSCNKKKYIKQFFINLLPYYAEKQVIIKMNVIAMISISV